MYMWESVVIGSTIVRHGEDGLWTRGREIFGAEPCAVNLCNNGGRFRIFCSYWTA